MIKRMLVAFDGSGESRKALDYAITLAEQTSSEIQILTVAPPVFLPTYSSFVLKSKSIRDCQEELETSFRGVLGKAQSYIEKNKANLKVSIKFSSGVPHKKIVKTAKEGKIDIIIMGSRGLTGMFSFQGSTSSKVIDEAKCPVLIVK